MWMGKLCSLTPDKYVRYRQIKIKDSTDPKLQGLLSSFVNVNEQLARTRAATVNVQLYFRFKDILMVNFR